jgi:2-amino-4-hydroxy-6-hydroxymethyldihydropteridine diphosphokinase
MTNGKILLLGTNLGDRWNNLIRCREMIAKEVGNILQASSIYETAAWGKTDQPSFLNQVLIIETGLTPVKLLKTLNVIEDNMGRVRKEKWGERLIDIDILYYDDLLMDTPELKIPHPEIINRRFTLEPLNELAPNLIDLKQKLSVLEMLQICTDSSDVIKKADS